MESLYIVLGLLTGFIWGVTVYLDKTWIMPQIRSDVFIGASAGILSPLYFGPFIITEYVSIPSTIGLLYAGLAGVFYTVPLYFYLAALRRDDPAVVSPMFRLTPVITVVLAALLLGQIVSLQMYIGIGIVFIGVFLVTISKRTITHFEFSPAILYAVTATALFAIGNIFIELSLGHMNVWTYLYWSRMVGFIPALGLLLLPSSRVFISELIKDPFGNGIVSVVVTKTLEIFGSVLYSLAVSLGPVTIVSTLSSLETVFVVVFVTMSSLYYNKPIPPRKFIREVSASILVVIGVALIYF